MRDTSDKSLLCLGWAHEVETAFEHFTTSAASSREASIAARWTLRYLWNDFVKKRDAAQAGRGPPTYRGWWSSKRAERFASTIAPSTRERLRLGLPEKCHALE
ncbi:hypothetical protein JCM8202_000445 [Rhodotorula sphaerocarpa]